jgi:transcriptional regulator with XRE-family HTH domain
MLNWRMTSRKQAAARRRSGAVARNVAEDLRRLREDCGVSQRTLAAASGVPQSVISRIESLTEIASIETYARLAAGLGADLSIRVYPNTGPALRDRHQARIIEAAAAMTGAAWKTFLEVGVRQPVRGWIDAVLVRRDAALIVAAEIESAPHRLEQVLRWAGAKADALPSSSGYPFGITDRQPVIERLLILRDTEGTRRLAADFQTTVRAAYPGDPWQALASLSTGASWPGSSLLWARESRQGLMQLRAAPVQPRPRSPR